MMGAKPFVRFKTLRIVGASLAAAVFANYAFTLIMITPISDFDLLFILFGLAYGTLGLVLAVPFCLAIGVPLTRWMEARSLTTYQHAGMAGASLGGAVGLTINILVFPPNPGSGLQGVLGFIVLCLMCIAVGSMTGLVFRRVLGQPRRMPLDYI